LSKVIVVICGSYKNAQVQVAVVGGTGRLGSLIVKHLLAQNVGVTILTRKDSKNKVNIDDLQKKGAKIVEVDLNDEAALVHLLRGHKVLISSLLGGPDLIFEGQRRLLRASKSAGVQKFIPSDFSFDYRNVEYGINVNIDDRKRFNEELVTSGIQWVSILCGAFTEILFGFAGSWNKKESKFIVWGDGSQYFDTTTYEDTARFTVAAALNDRIQGFVPIAGDQLSWNDIAKIYEEVKKVKVTVESKGTIGELRNTLNLAKKNSPNPWATLPLQYALPVASGEAKFRSVKNSLFPEITTTTTVREFLKQNDV